MHPRRRPGSLFGIARPAILVVVVLAHDTHGQTPAPWGQLPGMVMATRGAQQSSSRGLPMPRGRVLISDVRLKRAAEAAIRAALTRVAATGCRDLLSDFGDEHGQPLTARLEKLGLSLYDFLQTVLFVDGSRHRACQDAVAVTMPGSRVVYLCRGLIEESRNDAWVAIVHEMLHSLGLGERPPTPEFISNRVRVHCR